MQIENTVLRVKAKTLGAELVSIYDKRDHTEHLWQANPTFWAAHAPVLFPIVGRSYNDSLLFNGKKYSMEKHGFARRNEFQLLAQTDTSITFELCSTVQLEAMYPFNFSFKITYSLNGNTLTTNYTVENKGVETMPFALGAHPAFAVPFFENEAYTDYSIVFPDDSVLNRHHINTDGFFDGRMSVVKTTNSAIALHSELFAEDALIFKDLRSKEVIINSKKHNKRLRVKFNDFPYLGIWAKPGANYVCVEPWIGCADAVGFSGAFTEKERIVLLENGTAFKVKWDVVFEL